MKEIYKLAETLSDLIWRKIISIGDVVVSRLRARGRERGRVGFRSHSKYVSWEQEIKVH